MKIETEILKEISYAFEHETGLALKYHDWEIRGSRSDNYYEAQLELHLDDSVLEFLAEIKKNLTDSAISTAAIHANNAGPRFAIAAKYITPRQAKTIRDLGLSYFDTAGNAYVKEPGVYILISGKKAKIEVEQLSHNIFTWAGLRAVFAFIQKPGLELFDYRTIEEETGVPRSSLGRVMASLETSGFLVSRGNRERYLTRKPELIKRWAEAYSETFRPKLKPLRYHSTKSTGRWWNEIELSEYNASWGGETGGAKLTKYLSPQTVTIYADTALPRLQAKYGLVRHPTGECEILKRFWKFGEKDDVAPPLVVYADLLATADERNIETARMIYDQYLASLAEENS